MTKQPIHIAIQKVGGLTAMARKVGTSKQVVYYWMRKGRIPAWRIRDVARAARMPQEAFK